MKVYLGLSQDTHRTVKKLVVLDQGRVIKSTVFDPIEHETLGPKVRFDWGTNSVGAILLEMSLFADVVGKKQAGELVAKSDHRWIADLSRIGWSVTEFDVMAIADTIEKAGAK